jgi:inorganic pyrophosphatase
MGPEAPRVVRAVVETPEGTTAAWRYSEALGRFEYAGEYELPVPAHYGWICGTRNPADEDETDVFVVDPEPRRTGDVLWVRPVALLRKADGDHKVLAIAHREACPVSGVKLAPVKRAIEAAFHARGAKLEGWGGRKDAETFLRETRHRPEPAGRT